MLFDCNDCWTKIMMCWRKRKSLFVYWATRPDLTSRTHEGIFESIAGKSGTWRLRTSTLFHILQITARRIFLSPITNETQETKENAKRKGMTQNRSHKNKLQRTEGRARQDLVKAMGNDISILFRSKAHLATQSLMVDAF